MKNNIIYGHLSAALTILIWGTTFISTKILLTDFKPLEILLFRFVMGFLILSVICPKRLKGVNASREAFFAGAGLCGITLYYLLENIALTFTSASNVGVIISAAPFFTSILARFFIKSEEKLKVNFYIGFAAAMTGIILISFNGTEMKFNPLGDLLALIAAMIWSAYSILIRKIGEFGYPVILSTRRIFFYGIVFMIPLTFFFEFHWNPMLLTGGAYLFNIIYLGAGASALCFVTWNFSVKTLGAVKTGVYIYMVPVITLITSVLVLKESVTWLSVFGTLLTAGGLLISEYGGKKIGKKH